MPNNYAHDRTVREGKGGNPHVHDWHEACIALGEAGALGLPRGSANSASPISRKGYAMRLGKAERAAFAVERKRMAEARLRAALVPDNGGTYASASGKQVVTVASHFNHTGWSSANARRLARA